MKAQATAQAINTPHQIYIVKQMNVEVIMAVGESKSALRSVEFHWHKLQWRK